MEDQQLMEHNLAKLVIEDDGINYQSLSFEKEQNPVNPFSKPVFEKRLRRSSVASENKHPNIRHQASLSYDMNQDYQQQIEHIFMQAHAGFEKIQRKVLENVQKLECKTDQLEKHYKIKDLLQNLQNTMKYVQQYAEDNTLNEKTKRNQNNSTFEIDTYHCGYAESIVHDTEQDTNYYYEKFQLQTKKTKPKEENKKKKQGRNKSLTGSMVCNGKKSIYESVLEERKLRKSKKKLI